MCVNAVALKAHFDGKQICLDEAYPLQPNSRLMVFVMPEPGGKDDREELHEMGRQSLARAYGDHEPDYSEFLGKKLPPE